MLSFLDRLDLQIPELKLQKGNLLTTLDVFGKEFIVDLKFKYTTLSSVTNIIQFTTGSDICHGCRFPAIYLKYQFLSIVMWINRNNNHYVTIVDPVPMNTWLAMRIQQVKEIDGRYNYSIFINNSLKHSIYNDNAQDLKNVKVYASSPFHPSAKGLIKDFIVYRKNLFSFHVFLVCLY